MARSKTHTYQVREGFHTPLIRMPTLQETLSLTENLDASVTEAGGTGLGDLLFSSDWDTATGSGDSAVLDGGIWPTRFVNGGPLLSVVTNPNPPGSNTNCLRCDQGDAGTEDDLIGDESPTALWDTGRDVTTTPPRDVIINVDFRADMTNNVGGHNFQGDRDSYPNVWAWFKSKSGSKTDIWLGYQLSESGSPSNPWPRYLWWPYADDSPVVLKDLVVGRWYNMQMRMEYNGMNEHRFFWRCYDLSDDSLYYDVNDFWGGWDYPDDNPTTHLIDWYDIGGNDRWLSFNESQNSYRMDNIGLGNNGDSDNDSGEDPYYFSRVRVYDVGTTTWDQGTPWVPLP